MGKFAYSVASFSPESKRVIYGLRQPAAAFIPQPAAGEDRASGLATESGSRLPQSKRGKAHSLAFPQILMHGSVALTRKVRFVLALHFPFSE